MNAPDRVDARDETGPLPAGPDASRARALHCAICLRSALPSEQRRIRCNVRRFRDRQFGVWRCTHCKSLHCEPVDDLDNYYAQYPIRNQRLDYFTRAWYREVLRRLLKAGVTKQDRILDYGCNQGLFLDFLAENGFEHCQGYDPYVERYRSSAVLDERFDLVISLDVIEHDRVPRDFLARLAGLVKPGGRLCIETPNASGIPLDEPEEYLHALHVPYHLHILSAPALADLAAERQLLHMATYDRWYMDTWPPGTARRLFESLMMHAGNDLDVGYEPPRLGLFLRHPSLLFHLFFGYFLPQAKKDHMMMIWRAPA
jgi:2-polyprenyl-3-methyl-5-hydroxy-6-metoxy-1,4-benzoquinol methylase